MGVIIEYFGTLLRWVFFLGTKKFRNLENNRSYNYIVGFISVVILGFLLFYIQEWW